MTQLYVGNLSAEGDEKAIRALFSRYGVVREVLMKNGYAFVEFEDACSADTAMRDLNGELICLLGACVLASLFRRVSILHLFKIVSLNSWIIFSCDIDTILSMVMGLHRKLCCFTKGGILLPMYHVSVYPNIDFKLLAKRCALETSFLPPEPAFHVDHKLR